MIKAMVDAARPATSLLGKLRSSFGKSGALANPASVITPTSPTVPAVSTTQASSTVPITSTTEKLDILDAVLSEVEQQAAVMQAQVAVPTHAKEVLSSAPALMVPEVQSTLEVQQTPEVQPIPEVLPVAEAVPTQELSTPETVANAPAVEAATGVQYVEQEPVPEISPEVAEYLEHVENHSAQQPQEIVIAPDQQNIPLATTYPKQSVVVLPITPGVEQEGIKKGPLWSIRWLVEWSRKLMKMFSGKIIYREIEK